MSAVRPRWLTTARAAFALAVVVNLLLLYWPRAVGEGGLPYLDKVAHLLTFASLAWTGLWAGIPLRWLVGVLALHAVLSEVVQARLLSGRSGDVADVAADLVGILVGTLLARASLRDDHAARALRTTRRR